MLDIKWILSGIFYMCKLNYEKGLILNSKYFILLIGN